MGAYLPDHKARYHRYGISSGSQYPIYKKIVIDL